MILNSFQWCIIMVSWSYLPYCLHGSIYRLCFLWVFRFYRCAYYPTIENTFFLFKTLFSANIDLTINGFKNNELSCSLRSWLGKKILKLWVLLTSKTESQRIWKKWSRFPTQFSKVFNGWFDILEYSAVSLNELKTGLFLTNWFSDNDLRPPHPVSWLGWCH